MPMKFLRIAYRAIAMFVALAVLTAPVAVKADDYNNGAYGSDTYNSSSRPSSESSSASSGASGSSSAAASSAAEPTVLETESGLQVAINLANGQAIPPTGYYITITPLNGQGKSFDKAEIYLDGELAHSGAPDATGTLKWLWDTASNPARKVKVVVFGPGGGTTTHEFEVTVTPVESASAAPESPDVALAAAPAADGGWPWWLAPAGAGLLLIVLAGLLLMRRRQRGHTPPPPSAFTPVQ